MDVLSGQVVLDAHHLDLTVELGRPRLSGPVARLRMPAPPADPRPITLKAHGRTWPDGSLVGHVLMHMGRRELDAELTGRLIIDRSSLLVEGRWDVEMKPTRSAPLIGTLSMVISLAVHATRRAAPQPR